MTGLADLGHDPAVWVLPEHKIVYVAVPKNACSTVKRALARIAGEDLSGFRAGLRPYTGDAAAVHNRTLYRHIRHVDEVDRAVMAQARPDNGWFVFGIVRDPRLRLFSAWQDKLLLRGPGFGRERNEPWYPSLPADPQAVTDDWRRFVAALGVDPAPALLGDDHFASQRSHLRPEVIPYSRIYPISELGALRADLVDHLGRAGIATAVEFERDNDTPLPARAVLFADGVDEQIRSVYADDFADHGDLWAGPVAVADEPWTPAQLREAGLRASLNYRIDELRTMALVQRRRAVRATQQNEELREHTKDLRRQLRQSKKRITRLEARSTAADRPEVRERGVSGRIARAFRRSGHERRSP